MSRKWLGVALKATVSIALIWFLLDRVDLQRVLVRARSLDPMMAVVTLAVIVLQTGFITARWWLVSRLIAAPLGLAAALRIVVIGLFFNQTLPSSIGGDAVRVWLTTRLGIPLGKAVNGVLSDRVLALAVLVALIGVSLPAVYTRIDDAVTRTVLSVIVGAGVAGFALFLGLGKRLADILSRWRYTRPFGALARDFHGLFVGGSMTVALVALSVATHLLSVTTIMLLAHGLGLYVSFIDCLVVFPTVMLIATVPISVAGWGVREGAMVVGFGFVGIGPDDALALSVVYGLAQIVIALPGGFVWLTSRPSNGLADVAKTSAAGGA